MEDWGPEILKGKITVRETCLNCGAQTVSTDPVLGHVERFCPYCVVEEHEEELHSQYDAGYSDGRSESYDKGYADCEKEYKKRLEFSENDPKTGAKELRAHIVALRNTHDAVRDKLIEERDEAQYKATQVRSERDECRGQLKALQEEMTDFKEELEQAAELIEHREDDVTHLQNQVALLKIRLEKKDG